nr:uncharacterized protein C22orf46 homolog [Meriones unguiculatus]
MLLPLLGACAVMGPFQGPEWEPVRDLLSQDQSCKDPRCCGNLLVFCLFLIWQIQQFWYQVFRTSKRNVTKVPPQGWAVSATTCDTFFGMIPEVFTYGRVRALDVHVQQWAQQQKWEHQKKVRQEWATLLSPQDSCQDVSWVGHTSSEPIFCASSFSSTCLLPQDDSWEEWQAPWCLTASQTHPSLDMCQRMEQLLAPSQERSVPVEPVRPSYKSTPTSLAISLPNFPSAQRPEFCLREFLPDSLNRLPPRKSLDSLQGPLALRDKTQTVGRKYCEYTNKRENRRRGAWETQASGDFIPKKGRDAEALGRRNQRQVKRGADGEISVPGWKEEAQVRTEDREQTEKLWKKSQRKPGDKNPFTWAHLGESQEQFRYKTDIATQTPEWGHQEDAVQTPALGQEKEKEARGEGEAEDQDQGLETQGWTGSKNSVNSQMLKQSTQDQTGRNTGTETEAEEGRHKGQIASKDGVKIQTSQRENLREIKLQDNKETQACFRPENEDQIPAEERQGQCRSDDWKTQACTGENQHLFRHEVQVGMKKKIREVREEDWVVIQAPWWGSQRLVLITIDRGLGTPCWGNQNQVRGECTADILLLENDRGKGGDDGTNNPMPEVEDQGQLSGKTDLETYPVGSQNKEKIEEESGTDNLVLGKRDLREVTGENEARTQELGEENQGQLGNKFHKMIHGPKWKNEKQIRGNDSINSQTPETENWEGLTSKKVDDKTHATGHKKAVNAGGEDGAEVLIQGRRILRGARGEGAETKTAMEESQSWLGDMGPNTLKNQKQVGSEDGTEVQALEKRNRREPGEDDVETQRSESKNQRQLTETGGSHSVRQRSWKQSQGDNTSENEASEKKNWRGSGRRDGRKMQRSWRKPQRLLSKVGGKTYLLEWKKQQNVGDGNEAELQTQGKRSLRGFTGDDGPETQALLGKDQRQSVCETVEKIQTQGQRIQSKGRDAAAEIQDVGVQRKCRAEDAKLSHTSRRGDKGQLRRKDAARPSLQGDSCGRVEPTCWKCSLAQPASLTSGYTTPRHKQPTAGNGADSAPCPEEHLSSQGAAPAGKHRGGLSVSSQRTQHGSQRRHERDKRVDPGKAAWLTCQHSYPQSQASSVFPSLLCPQVSQAAPAPVSGPTALSIPHKWPALKKSQHLLLESLMKRKIAHLRWGFPRRILESYLLFHFLESCSLPKAGVRLPGLRTDQEHQRQQEQHCESLGPESPGRSQSRPVLQRKSSKLSTQVPALEKCRPSRLEPMSRSIPPKKPRRTRPQGGGREPQIQEAPKATVPSPSKPRPAAQSRSWCGPGPAQELFIDNSRGGKMVGSGVSHAEKRASSRVRASSCPEGLSHRKEEPSELPRLQSQQPTHQRSGSMGHTGDRRAWQRPSCCSAHSSSFKGTIHSAAARLGITILNKMPWLPQHSAPILTLRNPNPFSKVGAPSTREDSTRDPTALERDLEPPGHCQTGLTVPETEHSKECEAPGNPRGAPQNPAASQKFGFMRNLRHFLRQCGLKK